MNLAAILQKNGGIDRCFVNVVVHRGHNPAAQFQHVGTIDDGVIVLVFSGFTKNQARRRRVIHAELCFKAILRCFLAGQFQHQGMYFQVNALNFRSFDAMLVAQLYASIDAGVNDNAAGKWLVGIE